MAKKHYDKPVRRPLTDDEYLVQFGIFEAGRSVDPKKIQKAYEKAWEIRNFEIDKLWTRAAYFWGFIAAIFAGYIAVMTSEHNCQALKMRLDLYLILLGMIFSVAWLLVIKGSKWWQENWEAHVNHLEDDVSGPLYKTTWYTTKGRRYSVSTINEVLAKIIIGVWGLLLLQYLCNFFFNLFKNGIDLCTILVLCIILALALTVVCVLLVFWLFRHECLRGSDDKITIPEGKSGVFTRRKEDKPE